ncbi:ArnT family glycosyltransferase [Phenylobacterium sp.]|jgi:4-amino-4-deoxy-L-arabinose transferase-like glycosyltransferase|uniref:ArnT family glycosyltransferase n=1 Tax=Phenylobacterium sp. TaxID=1871053 RepID=UPI002F405063
MLDTRRSILLLAVALTALRILAAGAIHLTEDEAYYRLWAQHLQFGYFDHPPMIAWWIRLGRLVAGDTALGVRLLPALASGLNTWLIGDLALRLGAQTRTAFRAALWYNATLTVCLGGMLAIPDAPASLFWTLTLWALARFWNGRRAVWWLAAGVSAGLAVLSKYSGLFLGPGVLLWLLVIPGGSAQLRKPGPWAALVLAALVFSVNVAWNAQHHWLTFDKQFGRVAAHGLTPAYLGEFLGTQILLFTPLMAVYAAMGMRQGWRERAQAGAVQLALPIATSAPFAAYLVIHSLHDRVQGHWPAPLFGALAICAAVAAERSGETRLARLARWLAPALGFGAGAVAFALMALAGPTSLGPLDPTLALRGWPEFAGEVEQIRARTGAAWVGTLSYGVYAQLDDEGRIKTSLLQVNERDRYWLADPHRPDLARAGLIVDISRRANRTDILRCFENVTPVSDLSRAGGVGKNQQYGVFLVSGPRRDIWTEGCPKEVTRGVWR